jgi:ferredoxin
MAIQVTESLCPQNHRCPALRACPVDALEQKGYSTPTVNAAACIDCAKCTRICPTGALQLDAQRSGARPASLSAFRLRWR